MIEFDENIELFGRLIERGYNPREISENIKKQLPELDVRKPALPNCYSQEGKYYPPVQVIAEAILLESDIHQIRLALAEFNLYWSERGSKPMYAHQLFIKHIQNRIKF